MSSVNDQIQVEDVIPDENNPQQYQSEMLNHNDIINAERIIAAAMERGTFKAKELVEVTAVYSRLLAFVESLPAEVRGQ